MNVTDEENHDLALLCSKAHGTNDKAEAEAGVLRQAWESHPDHTILNNGT